MREAILSRLDAIEIGADGLDRCPCSSAREIEPDSNGWKPSAIIIPSCAKPLIEGEVFCEFVRVNHTHGPRMRPKTLPEFGFASWETLPAFRTGRLSGLTQLGYKPLLSLGQ